MRTSVRFYTDLLGLEIIYGGEDAYFSGKDPILNLECGNPVTQWGRLIFYVSDVSRFRAYLKQQGLRPQRPQYASWGERYFHLSDPDGRESSFARPI